MDGLNEVRLIGSVGKDAELKQVGENSQVAKFSVATNRSWKNKDGEKQTATEWHNVEVWAETAKFAGQFVKKGQLVLVLGEIRTEKFEDKEGRPQQRTKIVANKIQLFPKGDSKVQAPSNVEANSASAQTEQYVSAGDSQSSDDLPF